MSNQNPHIRTGSGVKRKKSSGVGNHRRRQEVEKWTATGIEIPGDTERAQADYIAKHRSELVAQASDRARELIAEAQPLVEVIGTTPDEASLLRSGSKAEVDAFRKLQPLVEEFDALLDGYRYTWLAATDGVASVGPGTRWDDNLRPSPPGGLAIWQHPHQVVDIDVRDGYSRTLAHIAAHDEQGRFRLLDGPGFSRLVAEIGPKGIEQAPARLGGHRPRVYLPAKPKPKFYKRRQGMTTGQVHDILSEQARKG